MDIIKTIAAALSSAWLISVLLALFYGFKTSIGAGVSIFFLGPIATTYQYFSAREEGPLKRWCGASSLLFLGSSVLFFVYFMITGE